MSPCQVQIVDAQVNDRRRGRETPPKNGSRPARDTPVTAGPPPFPPHARVARSPHPPISLRSAMRELIGAGGRGALSVPCGALRAPRVRRNFAPPCPQSVAACVPPIRLPVSRASPCGRPLAAPWPSPALSPTASRSGVAGNQTGNGEGVVSARPARRGPRRPGGGAPRPWGRLQCPQAGKRRPQRRGPPAAAPPPLPPWALVRALPRRPSRPSQVLARLRACDNCRPLRLHAIAPTGNYLFAARPSPSGRHLLPPCPVKAAKSSRKPFVNKKRPPDQPTPLNGSQRPLSHFYRVPKALPERHTRGPPSLWSAAPVSHCRLVPRRVKGKPRLRARSPPCPAATLDPLYQSVSGRTVIDL